MLKEIHFGFDKPKRKRGCLTEFHHSEAASMNEDHRCKKALGIDMSIGDEYVAHQKKLAKLADAAATSKAELQHEARMTVIQSFYDELPTQFPDIAFTHVKDFWDQGTRTRKGPAKQFEIHGKGLHLVYPTESGRFDLYQVSIDSIGCKYLAPMTRSSTKDDLFSKV